MLFIVLALMLFQSAPQPEVTAAQEQARTEMLFDMQWQRYLLPEFGCPLFIPDNKTDIARTLTKDDCTLPPQIKLDEKRKACELALKVFGIEGKCPK